MSRGLEALKNINLNTILVNERYGRYIFNVDINIIEKELKSLEIIKEKKVEVLWLINKSLEDYNKNHFYELTQEEYDLLKEVLENE